MGWENDRQRQEVIHPACGTQAAQKNVIKNCGLLIALVLEFFLPSTIQFRGENNEKSCPFYRFSWLRFCSRVRRSHED
jgi:hypothetical protein